jgi:hypothetical protein
VFLAAKKYRRIVGKYGRKTYIFLPVLTYL